MPRIRQTMLLVVGTILLSVPALAAEDLMQRFDRLSNNGNSNCSVAFQQSILAMPAGQRLQGSCCGAMAYDHYVKQIEGLAAYSTVPEIPADPYDIEAGAAQMLLVANEMQLSADEQGAFDFALQSAEEGGPCCCRCWRWEVYSGLAKKLIRERGFSGEQIGEVWDLSSGCGG